MIEMRCEMRKCKYEFIQDINIDCSLELLLSLVLERSGN